MFRIKSPFVGKGRRYELHEKEYCVWWISISKRRVSIDWKILYFRLYLLKYSDEPALLKLLNHEGSFGPQDCLFVLHLQVHMCTGMCELLTYHSLVIAHLRTCHHWETKNVIGVCLGSGFQFGRTLIPSPNFLASSFLIAPKHRQNFQMN